ncbi:MAG: signal recognition particle protein, partial [Microvirga sp.]
ADSLTGQDAVNLARSFDQRVGLTGIVLTRVDGDGRGGAALSTRAVTGKPIKLMGTGERMDALEDFHPARIADRILGMGDIVSLVEKAATSIDREQAMRAAERMRKGQFDLTDMREQLAVLGRQVGVDTLPIVAGQSPVQIARRALEAARLGGFDVVMLDTAGRVTIDEALMAEVAEVKTATDPHEVLLVADALTGQDAVNTARAFDERLGVTGIVLTRMDGDARGGAALSMRAVTGKPVKLIGTGEKMDALEEFHPKRIADRILGMGDIVSLVEKAAENIDQEKALRAVEKMRKGKFDLDDLRDQLAQMDKIGGMGGVMGMLPGIGKMKAQIEQAGLGDGMIRRQRAIIDSMTPKERRNPDLLKASRKKRIASGSGTRVEEVNKLLKMHRQMADMMKMMGGGKGRGIGAALGNMMGFGGGGMPQPSPEMLAEMQKKMGGGMPGMPGGGGLPPLPPGLGGKGPAMPGGLPGLGGPKLPGLPGLGGFNPFGAGKKK